MDGHQLLIRADRSLPAPVQTYLFDVRFLKLIPLQEEMAPQEQSEQLMEYSDLLKLGLAGNLKHYTITDRTVGLPAC